MSDENGGDGDDNVIRSLEITRLARLSLIDYDGERLTAHERLGLRMAILDKLVMNERARLEKAERDATATLAAKRLPREVGEFPPTERSLAKAFLDDQCERLRYNHTQQQWFIHSGIWQRDKSAVVYAEVIEFLDDKRHFDYGKKRLVDAVERLARVDRRVATIQEDWDTDPWLLGTPEGTVDLTTGELRKARPEELISKMTAVAPSEDAECPLFDDFVRSALGDDELIGFLDRYLGYCLSGVTREEFLLFMYGKPGRGKGTLTKSVLEVMRDYASPVPIEMFTDRSGKQEYYRAMLYGLRFVVAAEPENGSNWNEAFVNELTGGDPINGRHPSGRPFRFNPSHKPCMHGNKIPALRSEATGLVRRLGILPFEHAPQCVNLKLKEQLVEEYPAILRRMVNGCVSYRKRGLMVPEKIRSATIEYFERQDTLSRFVDDMDDDGKYRRLPGACVRSGELRLAYNKWADDNGERKLSSRHFYELIESSRDPSIRNKKSHRNRSWVEGLAQVPEKAFSEKNG